MINKDCWKYCCEDVSNIENYSAAIADTEYVWHCHHRNEVNGDKIVSKQRLIADGLYYKRPAAELIFLNPGEHYAVHHGGVKPLLAKYTPITTFQEFLNEKSKIVRKYEFWNQRNPENKAENDRKMQTELDELLEVYSLGESGYFKKVAKAIEHGGRVERKLLTKGDKDDGHC